MSRVVARNLSGFTLQLTVEVRHTIQDLFICHRGQIKIEEGSLEPFKRAVPGKVTVQARCSRRVKEGPPVRV